MKAWAGLIGGIVLGFLAAMILLKGVTRAQDC